MRTSCLFAAALIAVVAALPDAAPRDAARSVVEAFHPAARRPVTDTQDIAVSLAASVRSRYLAPGETERIRLSPAYDLPPLAARQSDTASPDGRREGDAISARPAAGRAA